MGGVIDRVLVPQRPRCSGFCKSNQRAFTIAQEGGGERLTHGWRGG